MHVLVHGIDRPAFESGQSELDEAHQSYTDGWSSALVGRGPTRSPDGSEHAGSVHVVEVDGLGTARGFAWAEPYAHAGWYASIAVRPMVSCIDGTMWDRPIADPQQPSAFVTAAWEPIALEQALVVPARKAFVAPEGPPWLFGGLLLDDDLTEVCGLAGGIDLPSHDARRRLTRLAEQLAASRPIVEARRWMRGGRG